MNLLYALLFERLYRALHLLDRKSQSARYLLRFNLSSSKRTHRLYMRVNSTLDSLGFNPAFGSLSRD